MPAISQSRKKHIYLFVRLGVVTGGLLWAMLWFSREGRWGELVDVFRRLNIGIFAIALLIFIFSQIIIGLRWWLLLRSQEIFIGFWVAVRLYLLGWFYNNFMPGSVGGDLVRAWYVTKHTDKKFEGVLSVFVDRLIGLLSTLVIAVFFYTLFLRGRGSISVPSEEETSGGGLLRYWYAILIVLVLFFAAAILVLLKLKGRGFLNKGWQRIREYIVRLLVKLKDAIVVYCSRPMTIVLVFALRVALQLMTITGFWLLGWNLGIEVSIKYYFVFFTLTWVLGSVPVSIGGVVVVEFFLISLFVKFAGVAPEQASALALCQRAVWMLASLPGAAIHIFGAHLPKEIAVDYGEDMD